MSIRFNALDQALDIAGSILKSSSYTLADEANGLGPALAGQSGTAASLTTVTGGLQTVTGLTGMTAASIGDFLVIANGATPANNGEFRIAKYLSATSVQIANASAVASDGNNGSIQWTERKPYTLEDDLNYARTDRAAIKGVAYSAAIPTYTRPDAASTNVPASLANIAGKTTDAKALVTNRKFAAQTVAATNTFVTLTSAGNMKSATSTDRTGIPINDGFDSGNDLATYVEVINPATEAALEVISDNTKRIYGRTRQGSSTSPNSVEVEFRQVTKGAALSTSTAYTWEAGQPTTIDLYYGYRDRLDNLAETALRTVLTNGIVGDADLASDISDVRSTMGTADNTMNLGTYLTNTTSNYVFSTVGASPTVVSALNALNGGVGARNYTGTILTSGQSISASLQALANAASAAGIVRTIERVSSDINAGAAHTIPGGQLYVLDSANNGLNMWVFVRGLLQDPGPIAAGNNYEETSTTSVTFYTKVRANDHISYMIFAR